jgi:segregation and condensation protein B
MDDLKNIIESLLFVAEDPISLAKLRQIIPRAESSAIREALSALSEEYAHRQGAFRLQQVAGGYQIRTQPEYKSWIKAFLNARPARLSKPALESLAIIAYYKPITRAEIEHIRGVDCGGVLRMLLERKLIRVLGRKEIPGRPLIYETTKRFLEVFSLKDIKDLPSIKEIQDLTTEEPELLESVPPDEQPTEPGESGETPPSQTEAEAAADQPPVADRDDERAEPGSSDTPSEPAT